MSSENERVDAVVHTHGELTARQPLDGVTVRRVEMDTIVQMLIEIEKGALSPLHRHNDEQSIVLVSGKLRARSGPNGQEIYTEMEPGDIFTVPSNVIHQVEALDDSVFCEVHGPGSNY